jgi:hypothetical protein
MYKSGEISSHSNLAQIRSQLGRSWNPVLPEPEFGASLEQREVVSNKRTFPDSLIMVYVINILDTKRFLSVIIS